MRTRIRHIAQINPLSRRFDRLRDDDLVPFLPMEKVWPGGRLDLGERRPKSAVATGYTRFESGDVIVPKITPTFEAGRSVLVPDLPDSVAVGTTELHIVRPGPAVDPRFLLYILTAHDFLKVGAAAMYGVAGQKRVPDDLIRNWEVDLPRIDDQCRIADFLDAETTRLDDLASRVEAASALSAERLRAALDNAFDVFAADLVRFRFLLLEPLRYGANAPPAEHNHPDWPRYIRITDIDSQGRLRHDSFRSLAPGEARPFLLEDRDVLFARSGATVGKTFIYRSVAGPACFAGYLIRARFPGDTLLPELISYFAMTGRYWQQIASDTIQATIQNVSAERYGNILVPRIPVGDQVRTVSEFDEHHSKHRQFAALADRQLSLLAERRQALITAAVTGQIDVTTARGVAT